MKQYAITDSNGNIRSRHNTLELAEARMERNLAWRCGICGSSRGGWGACSHGRHNQVCSAEHYNDSIERIYSAEELAEMAEMQRQRASWRKAETARLIG